MPSLLAEIAFASIFAYAKSDRPDVRNSLRVRDAVKHQTATFVKGRLADLIRSESGRVVQSLLTDVLGTDAILVPVPGHAPLRNPRSHWASREICAGLVALGFGSRLVPCLRRTEVVPKSAFSKASERPDVHRHFDTMAVTPSLGLSGRVVVVDDVVTTGATLLAAASRVSAANSRLRDVSALALVRYLSDAAQFTGEVAPTPGTIQVRGHRTVRRP